MRTADPQDVYIYRHRTADTGRVFYIGKGRARRHKDRSRRSDAWYVIANAHGFTPELIATGLDNEAASLAEQEAIDVYRRRGNILCNISLGGDGCYGYKHTPEHIARLRGNKFSLGKTSPFKGKRHTEETKKQLSMIRCGKDNGKWKGKKRSLESRMKMRAAKQGYRNMVARILTAEQVREIRATIGYRQVALFSRRYGVGESTIRRIRNRELYKDIS